MNSNLSIDEVSDAKAMYGLSPSTHYDDILAELLDVFNSENMEISDESDNRYRISTKGSYYDYWILESSNTCFTLYKYLTDKYDKPFLKDTMKIPIYIGERAVSYFQGNDSEFLDGYLSKHKKVYSDFQKMKNEIASLIKHKNTNTNKSKYF